jgi:hypothetical protein
MFDLNSDGVRDLAYGINWHYFQFCYGDPSSPHGLTTCRLPTLPTGAGIVLRDANGDDSTPDFGDLNGDGAGDMVDGGLLGKAVVLFAKPVP